MTFPLALPPATSNFRDLDDKISASWWNGPNGKRYRYSSNVLVDALADAAGYAVLARFPDNAPDDALVWLTADRQVFQGYAEPRDHFIGRLKQWLDIAAWDGTPIGAMMALLSLVFPLQPEILTVSTWIHQAADPGILPGSASVWYTYVAGTEPMPYPATIPAIPAELFTSPDNWRWDSLEAPKLYDRGWWRMWIVLFSVAGSPWPAPTHTLGDGSVLGDGSCLGWAGTNAQAKAITFLVRLTRSAHAVIPSVIVSYDATMFDSTQAFGSPKLPDGHWGRWGKVVGNVMVPSRPPCTTCSFVDGAA